MDLLNDSDFRFEGMFLKLDKGGMKLGQVLEVVIIMSIQFAKDACMVCPQRLVFVVGPLGRKTMGMFSILSMASKCVQMMGISGQFCVA